MCPLPLLPPPVSIFQQCASNNTLSSTARLLANLAIDDTTIPLLHSKGVIRELSHALIFRKVTETAARVNVLRGLRLLSNNESCRAELWTYENLFAIISCLEGENEDKVSALQTLDAVLFSRDPKATCALVTAGCLHNIVQLCSHARPEVVSRAVAVLALCSQFSEGRVALSRAGGVERLVQQLQGLGPSSPLLPSVVGTLCGVCRDVLGRQRMRDSGGLETLIHFLSDPALATLHDDIVSAVVCYYFDELSLKLMVKRMGLPQALTCQLRLMTSRLRRKEEGGGGGVDQEEGKEEQRAMAEESEVSPRSSCDVPGSDSDTPIKYRLPEFPFFIKFPLESSGLSYSSSTPEDTSSSNSSPQEEGEAEVSVRSRTYLNLPSSHKISSSSASSSPVSHLSEDHTSPNPLPPTTAASSSLSPSPSYPSSLSLSSPDATPPPIKRHRLSTDLNFPRPMPANFIDSLLSSPNPYQSHSKTLYDLPLAPGHVEWHEDQVVQLISRISHLCECLCYLASTDLLQALIDFLLSSPSTPDTHIVKTLFRIFTNPDCLQECVVSFVPSQLHHQIYMYYSSSSSSSSPSTAPPWTFNSAEFCAEPWEVVSPFQKFSHRISLTPSLSSLSAHYGSFTLGSACRELLIRLSRVAESPYGQGVLAHMLLGRDERERTASSLAVPLLCR